MRVQSGRNVGFIPPSTPVVIGSVGMPRFIRSAVLVSSLSPQDDRLQPR
jgi:hypothetical protein